MKDTEVLEAIGAAARDRITSAYERMTMNGAEPETIRRVLVDMLTQSTGAARVDGEALALRQLEELGIQVATDYGTVQTPGSLVQQWAEDRAGMSTAVETILGDDSLTPEALSMKLGRLALAESIEAARAVTSSLMRGSRLVEGWIRQLDSDPCELCTWWHRDGRVWPADHEMPTHKGCACAQRWTRVASASVRMVSEAGRDASDERADAGTLEVRRTMAEGAYSSRSTRGSA